MAETTYGVKTEGAATYVFDPLDLATLKTWIRVKAGSDPFLLTEVGMEEEFAPLVADKLDALMDEDGAWAAYIDLVDLASTLITEVTK